ncbi:MAG TPA: VCBS repeat-containing protein [Usitatibacter sp.]|nr:VCBS repeat-containing protein [Usitatibacter sp.]
MTFPKAVTFALAAIAGACASFQAFAQASAARAVPTYEAAGIYWANSAATAATGCQVQFRKSGTTAWTQGLDMWLDARNAECRGSIVGLSPGTSYDVQLNLPGQSPAKTLTFSTWSNTKPVAKTVTVQSGSGTLNVTEGGTANGYVVYQGATGATLDANNAAQYNVSINASYVIVRGLTLKGAQQDAVRISPNSTDVIVEDNDVSGWGRSRSGNLGVDLDSGIRAVCPSTSTSAFTRITIQRNVIHDPRYTASSWTTGHPAGPQALTFSYCGGNNVIRHNEMYSTNGNYFNDVIGGEENDSKAGFPNVDSDIYGNLVENSWDDGIEAEGGDQNVRIWGNYLDNTGTGVASTIDSVGPLYIFRNVYNRSRILQGSPLDNDDRQVFFKSGSDSAMGDGRRYVFHNTMLQATLAGVTYGLGASGGISGTGPTQLANNTVSRNNIFQNWRTWTAYYDMGTGNDLAYDLYNGTAGAPDSHGIQATPVYAPGNGWTSEEAGQYALAAGTPGYDQGVRIANFNDDFKGAGPDVGAAEAGAGAMKFGVAASAGSAVGSGTTAKSTQRQRPDFNADGKDDLVLANADGRTSLALMNGAAIASSAQVMPAGSGWSVARVADFDGDGKADLVWQHTDGRVAIYLMNGTTVLSTRQVLDAGGGWTVTNTPDLDGDGKADLLFQNADGSVAAWTMDGTSVTAGATLMGPGTGWSVVLTADFDGDGNDDLLWKHTDGRVAIWLMNGTAVKATGQILNAASGWSPAAAADFDGDGKADIVWQHADGSVALWLMNGAAMKSGSGILGAGTGWSVAKTGDFNGDGKADILFQHADGRAAIYLMNGLTPTSTTQILNAGSGWHAAGIGDVDGDGKSDIVWRHDDGRIAVWIMNGATMASGAEVMTASGGWTVATVGP